MDTQTRRVGPDRVLLGFCDGSEVELDETSPAAVALRAVADVLVGEERVAAGE